ncbi:MAG: hypothetical protein R3B53_04555 [Candidatus Paceibacterota bacterium]
MTTTTTNSNDTANTHGVTDDETQSFAEEMGTLVFQSALMQYLAEADESTATEFENYVEQNVAKESFIDDLCATYSDFEKILKDEIGLLQSEIKEIIPDDEDEDEDEE